MDLFEIYLTKLKQAISIKSISTDHAYQPEIRKMVEWLEKDLKQIGFSVKVIEDYGNPVVIGYLESDPTYKSVLLYGHYDVQPAEKDDGWDSEPFELIEDEHRVYARGAMDNKGQFMIYLAAIQKLARDKNLGKNIIFLIEGNEETGSPLLSKLIEEHKESLKADVAVISDGLTGKNPVIEASFRGNVNSELIIYGPKNALHSGGFGGIVYNPINVLNSVLSKLSTETGDTQILKTEITKPNKTDDRNMKSKKYNLETFRDVTGYANPTLIDSYEIQKALGFENSIQITGITAGYVGKGFKNAIPTQAMAKINFRLNFGLDPKEVKLALEKFFKENVPDGVKYDYKCDDLSHGAKLDIDSDSVKEIQLVLEKVYKNKAVYAYIGGTLPIAHDIEDILKIPAIFAGLANDDSNMHGANENYSKKYINKALEFAHELLKKS